MCVSQRRWAGCRGQGFSILVLLPLSFLFSSPPLVHGAITIPPGLSQPPVLTAVPSSFTAFSLDDVFLPCEASGNPTPRFVWVKDGQRFGPEREGLGTLKGETTESLSTYDGLYRCYAFNQLGTAVSPTVRITVEDQPVIQKQKVGVRAIEGQSVVLTCNPPRSSTPLHINWTDNEMAPIKENERVIVGLNGSLYFSNVLKSDSRDDYICHAHYYAARTVLPVSAVTLAVTRSTDVVHESQPHLITPHGSHSSVLALRGEDLVLECIPTGLPTPKVLWKKKEGSLEDTTAHPEKHNRWLRFTNITQEDDGEYECRATNAHGTATHAFNVTVESAPYWVKEPQDLLYAPGETVRLDCQAEGIPTPAISWSIDGLPLSDLDVSPRCSVSGGVLILKDVGFYDTAVFQCEAKNKHGSILLNSIVYVSELPPQMLSSDGVVYRVIEGGDIMMHCDSFGIPQPQVTWEDEDGVPLLSDPRITLLTNGTIRLSNADHKDAGSYLCYIRHSNISITAQLEVFNRTRVVVEPQEVRVLRGMNVLLDCIFYTDPLLLQYNITWRKDGHELPESSPDDKFTVFDDGTLTVTDVQSDDSAQYSCEVSTQLDSVMASGAIVVVGDQHDQRGERGAPVTGGGDIEMRGNQTEQHNDGQMRGGDHHDQRGGQVTGGDHHDQRGAQVTGGDHHDQRGGGQAGRETTEVPVSDLKSSPVLSVHGFMMKDQTSVGDLPAEAVADSGQKSQPPPPPVRSVGNSVLEWVTWTGSIPNDAVAIYNDYESRPDYVCKVRCHAGFYTPAKGAHCYYTDAKIEYAGPVFEILVNRDSFEVLEWEDGSYGSVPNNSVKTCPGGNIYVGKNKYGLGMVDVKQQVFVLPWHGTWYSYNEYQVLTVSKDVVSQEVYDIKYITNEAKVINYPPETMHKTTLSNHACSPVVKTDTLTVTHQVSHRWDTDYTVALHFRTSFTVQVPSLSSLGFELGLDLSFQYSKGNTVIDSTTDMVSMDITAPPGQSCTVHIMRYKNKQTIPFTARLSRTYGNWDVHRTTITGTYSSVQVGEVRAVVDRCVPLNDTIPCP